jgi:hypothetical protein
MSTGIVIVIVVIAIVVVGAVVALVMSANRRRRLQQRFGPEYDRVVNERESRREAEAELASRERRVSELNIQPLEPAARARYAAEWATIQEQFVDAPQAAVAQAQGLVVAVMNDRGYPTEDRDQVLADLSVEHAAFLDHYRAAADISERATAGTSSTEDLRQAVIHYRALFQELLGESAGTGTAPAVADLDPADARLDPADARLDPADARPDTVDTRPGPIDSQPDPTDTEPADSGPAVDPESEPATAADYRRRAQR